MREARWPARTGWTLFVAAGLLACNAFPESLREAIPDGTGSDASTAEASESSAPLGTATLVFRDTGSHRGLAVVGSEERPTVVWSTNEGARADYRLRACFTDDCAEPRNLQHSVCNGDPAPMTGYVLGVGSRVLATNPDCQGWICAFDPKSEAEPACAYGTSTSRLFGDSAGVYATSGPRNGAAPPERRIVHFDPALAGSNLVEYAPLDVNDLPLPGENDLASSPARIYFTQSSPDGFRVLTCPRDLGGCEPSTIVPARPGKLTALAATDSEVFIAFTSGLETSVVRVGIPSGEERVLSKSAVSVAALLLVGDDVFWAEDGGLKRAARSGGEASRVGNVPQGVTHLATTTSGKILFLLAKDGVYQLPRPAL